MIIVSNLIFFVLSLLYFGKLRSERSVYGRRMGQFMCMLGISTVFGAVCHSVHFQLGETFFNRMFFLMNGFSLVAIYFCFLGSFTLGQMNKRSPLWIIWVAAVWIGALLIYSYVRGHFLLIKIHAGIVLVYALVVHLKAYRRTRHKGNLLVVGGIGASFVSIAVHSARFSLHEWFNYKDIAHVFMIIALVLIYKGVKSFSAAYHALPETGAQHSPSF